MKKLLTSGAFIFALFTLFSQSNTVSSGSDASSSSGTVTFSVGQIDYQSNSNANGTVSQGVQQAYEIYALGIKENSILMSVFPNPTTDILKLQFSSIDQLSFQLMDAKGKILTAKTITKIKTEIDMKLYSSGTYFLNVLKKNQKLETTKIIKH